MASFKVNLSIDQGATFRKQFIWKAGTTPVAVDLTGYTARMQIRADLESDTVLASLTTENGGITLGGTAGTVALYISDTDTAAFDWTDGVYDIEFIAPGVGGDVSRKVKGNVTVSPEVTRV